MASQKYISKVHFFSLLGNVNVKGNNINIKIVGLRRKVAKLENFSLGR